MNKSLIAIALTLLTNNLWVEIVTETYDSGPLIGVDSEGHVIDGRVQGTIVQVGPAQPDFSHPPACKYSELMVDGKVVAHHEENCEQADIEEFTNNHKESNPKKKVNF